MKLTAAQLKRLLELKSKSVTALTDPEKKELADLEAIAQADIIAGQKSAADAAESFGPEEVKGLVLEALKTFNATAEKPLTADQVKTLVENATKDLGGKIDAKTITDAVVADLKKLIPAAGVTAAEVTTIVTEAIKAIRPGSKMIHEGGGGDPEIDFPISHRLGNLAVDAKQLLNVMLKGGDRINDGISETILRDAERRGERQEKSLLGKLRMGGVNAQKAITTTGAGSGLEFMNSLLSSTLLQRMYLASELASALTAAEVQMPSNPFTYPLATTRPVFYKGSEGGTPTPSNPGTGELILNAKKLIGQVDYSYEADEDALIAILPQVLAGLGDGSAASLEDAIVNGDTAATHQDSDTHAVTNHAAKLFDGIRKLVLAQAILKVSLATGGISTANVGVLKKALGRWGLKPKDLLIVAGVNGYNDLVMLPETLTADKIGDKASARIYTGMAPNLLGIDIVASAAVREDLNASGVYDGTTTNKGSFFIIHKPSWIPGVRRGFTVEQDKNISTQMKCVVASFRRDFKPIESLANTRAAVMGYNYTSG
jgi:hypothetical protein